MRDSAAHHARRVPCGRRSERSASARREVVAAGAPGLGLVQGGADLPTR